MCIWVASTCGVAGDEFSHGRVFSVLWGRYLQVEFLGRVFKLRWTFVELSCCVPKRSQRFAIPLATSEASSLPTSSPALVHVVLSIAALVDVQRYLT